MSGVPWSASVTKAFALLDTHRPYQVYKYKSDPTPLLLAFKPIGMSNAFLTNFWECWVVDAFIPLSRERKRMGRKYAAFTTLCAEVSEMIVLDLSTPRRELLLHPAPFTPLPL